MSAQPTHRPAGTRGDFERLLTQRMRLGIEYMDVLCHGHTEAPAAVMLFRRLLHLDALLTSLSADYEAYHLEVLSVREDARYHQPGLDFPADHDVLPCALCCRLPLNQGVVANKGKGAA